MAFLAALAFTAVIGFSLMVLFETISDNARKIIAALEGHSLLSEPMLVTRPVKVRMTSRRVSRSLQAQPQLRAAA